MAVAALVVTVVLMLAFVPVWAVIWGRKEMAATQAIGRMGTPEEIAAAALYLASDEAAFVTGTALLIEGGFTVGK
jgi:NAD(P)-dependent dehydrogenase (short-subunit alcohol dehydrogenase family)